MYNDGPMHNVGSVLSKVTVGGKEGFVLVSGTGGGSGCAGNSYDVQFHDGEVRRGVEATAMAPGG